MVRFSYKRTKATNVDLTTFVAFFMAHCLRVEFFLTYTTDKPATALKQQRLALLEKGLGDNTLAS